MAEIPFEPYTGQGKLRFWCQKVLPLVYDDSLSYYEVLGKVVDYLNHTIEDVSACEDNITALRDAFVQLQDYVNEMFDDFAPEIERIIDEMIDSGEFGEILTDVVNGLIASEYDETIPYVQFAYCLKDGKLYCATGSTTGAWDETKWRETTIGNDLQLISRRLYNLNAGQVSYDNTATYDNGTVGKKLKDLGSNKLPHLESTGDTTDRYAEIMQCLNTYGYCLLGDGVFYINSTIGMPNNTTLSGVGINTVLQLADNATGQVAVNVGSYCLVKDMTIKGHSTELPYSSYTRGTRKGIALLGDYTDFNTGTYSHNYAKLSNLTIQDFDHSGIWANKNDGAASFLAENIDILRCHTGINIELFSEFHSFTNIRCRWCNIACVMQGGNNIFTNCHFDVNISNIECDNSQNTLINDSHSTFVGCSFCHPNNNSGYNVFIKGTENGWIFSNCQFWYGIIRFENTTGVILTNNIIGGTNNTIIITNCTQVIVADNIFKTQIPTVNIDGTKAAWLNNLNPDCSINFRPNYSSLGDVTSVYKYSGSLSSYTLETLGVCYEANKWRVTLPLGFVGVATRNVTITRIVLIGLGTVADLTGLNVTASDSFVRIDNIPYSGNVNDLAFINVRMNYSLT